MVDFDKDRDANLSAFERTGGAANSGLTVRDYFAAKALGRVKDYVTTDGGTNFNLVAEYAYKFADAMMKERNKPLTQPTPSVEEAFGLNK